MTEADDFAELGRLLPLDPYCSGRPRFVGTVDANALLSSVDNDCRYPGRRSRLLRMAEWEVAALYVPDRIYGEVYRRLPKIARSSPAPLTTLRERFEEEYLPALRFVTVSTADIVDPQVLAITDPDDVPLGQLTKLITPCVLFSSDKHLRQPGLAPPDWYAVAAAAIDVVDGVMTQVMTGSVSALPVEGAVKLIQVTSARLGISPWLLGIVAAAGVGWLLRKPERRDTVLKYAVPVFKVLWEMIEEGRLQEQRGVRELKDVILPAPALPSVKQQVAIVLARRREPLLAREVQDYMRLHFSDELVPTVTEVRNALKDAPEFFPIERYRWQLGRQAAPWRERV